ncbi:hypothetical protein Bbelb_259140 [Branchiostoma belcheri]|nr:hypothetical protein Bbelb_259140 [Branchiostoma belcheri]
MSRTVQLVVTRRADSDRLTTREESGAFFTLCEECQRQIGSAPNVIITALRTVHKNYWHCAETPFPQPDLPTHPAEDYSNTFCHLKKPESQSAAFVWEVAEDLPFLHCQPEVEHKPHP